MTATLTPAAEPVLRGPHRARMDVTGVDDRVLDMLCRRLEDEIAAAIQHAADAQARLGALHGAPSAPAPVHPLELAADRCRSASYHVDQASKVAFEILRLDGGRRG